MRYDRTVFCPHSSAAGFAYRSLLDGDPMGIRADERLELESPQCAGTLQRDLSRSIGPAGS